MITQLSSSDIAKRVLPLVNGEREDADKITKQELNGAQLGNIKDKDKDILEFVFDKKVFDAEASSLVENVISILKDRSNAATDSS